MKLALHLLAVLLTVEVSAPWPSAPWPVSSCLKCCRRKKDAEKKMETAKAAEERSGLLDDRAKLGRKEATRVDKEIKEVRKRTKNKKARERAKARTKKQNEAAKQQEDEKQRKEAEAGAEWERKQAECLKALKKRQRAQKAQAVIDAEKAEAAKEAAKKALDDAWDAEKDTYTRIVAYHFPPLAVHKTNWHTMPVQQYHSRVVRATFDESQKFLEITPFTKRSEFIEQRSFLGLKAALEEVNRIFVAYAKVFVQKRGVDKLYNCGDKSGMARNQKGGERNPIKVSTMLPSGLSDDALVALACNVLRAVDPGHRYCRPSDSMHEQGFLGFSLNMALVSFKQPPYNAPVTVPGKTPLKCHVHLDVHLT